MAYSNLYAHFYGFFVKIKASLGAIFKIKSTFVYLALIFIVQVVNWFEAWFIKKNLSGSMIVLHYNVDFGIDLVDKPETIFLYPLLALGIFLLNFILLAIFYKNNDFKILSHFLLGSALIFNLFLSGALVSVYLINFL